MFSTKVTSRPPRFSPAASVGPQTSACVPYGVPFQDSQIRLPVGAGQEEPQDVRAGRHVVHRPRPVRRGHRDDPGAVGLDVHPDALERCAGAVGDPPRHRPGGTPGRQRGPPASSREAPPHRRQPPRATGSARRGPWGRRRCGSTGAVPSAAWLASTSRAARCVRLDGVGRGSGPHERAHEDRGGAQADSSSAGAGQGAVMHGEVPLQIEGDARPGAAAKTTRTVPDPSHLHG